MVAFDLPKVATRVRFPVGAFWPLKMSRTMKAGNPQKTNEKIGMLFPKVIFNQKFAYTLIV